MYSLESEHAILLKRREDELITDMRKQLVKSHAEMGRQMVEAVDSPLSEHRVEIAHLEVDKQHVVNALAEYMNEFTRLRNTHQDYGEWDYDEEYAEEDGDHGDLEHWYRDETGHPEAVGVGDLDYGERVRRTGALDRTTD